MKNDITTDDLFPTRFLKAVDLGDADKILTIMELEVEGIGPKKEEKPVLYFNEIEKGLVLNKTNSDTIKELYGKTIADWAGKKIALYATEVEFGGKTSLGIRIRLRVPQGRKAAAPVVEEPEFPEEF